MVLIKDNLKIYFAAHRRGVMVGSVWLAIILLSFGAYALSSKISSRVYNAASVMMYGNSQVHEIFLYADKAIPSSVNVKVGDIVRFVGKDGGFHYVSTRHDGGKNSEPRLVSGEFGEGDSYELQFQNTGTFGFYDRLHLDTSVTIIVEK